MEGGRRGAAGDAGRAGEWQLSAGEGKPRL